ncbi:MAG TPA: GEVED domain-containing protein, partial [Pirellulaceae bacterium]|nr:GEVED domain-containing protein [Pirellulaceae bacterium]
MASDFGDAPDVGAGVGRGDYVTLGAYGGPSHVIDATANVLYLGAGVDADDGAAQDAAAVGDDRQGSLADDEDGPKYASELNGTIGQRPSISITALNATGRAATLYGWIDYNANGQFENGAESASIVVPSTGAPGVYSLNFPAIPSGYAGPTYARFRLSADPAAANPTGAAVGGEVEDHLFIINSTIVTVTGKSNPYLGGLPNGATARFSDKAPAQSPLLAPDLPIKGGNQYSFSASGSASNNGTSRSWGPNGASSFNRHSGGAENGIADLNAPTASLVGVFLSNERPDATTAPESLDFAQIGLNYGMLAPKLKQPFFI